MPISIDKVERSLLLDLILTKAIDVPDAIGLLSSMRDRDWSLLLSGRTVRRTSHGKSFELVPERNSRNDVVAVRVKMK